MLKNRKKLNFHDCIIYLITAGIVAVAVDVIIVFFRRNLSIPLFAIIAGTVLLTLLISRPGSHILFKRLARIILFPIVILICLYVCEKVFQKHSHYEDLGSTKDGLFSSQRVLVIAPHEDDDVNIAGGILDEYVKYGSEVYIAFVTNGDNVYSAERRLDESIKSLSEIGIAEDRIIFLGYGDEWQPWTPHIYNAADDEIVTSACFRTATYALDSHPAYNDGATYTRNNLKCDIKSLILDLCPDVILCCDYDPHSDHRATSMLFEEVIGEILSEDSSYKPLVLKSLSYDCYYYGENDFYSSCNLLSTLNPFETQYAVSNPSFLWEDRIRFPVTSDNMSHSIFDCSQYRQLSDYSSQGANYMAERIINGDKVFWQRRTDSLSYSAGFTVSSGGKSFLNDYKILDSDNLRDVARPPYDNLWHPDNDDDEKHIKVTLPESSKLCEIWLYDNPSLTDNISNVQIKLSDGSVLNSGPLPPNGSPAKISLNTVAAESLDLYITSYEGSNIGLTELELYSEDSQPMPRFIKATDSAGNFVYDYYIDNSGTESFSVYDNYGSSGPYSFSVNGEGCSVTSDENVFTVNCPKGRHCIVEISSLDGECTDAFAVSNPGTFYRSFGPHLEDWIRTSYHDLRKAASFRILQSAYRLARYGTITDY